MKKTISVNLANRNFYIEEDAYYVLDQYIKGIREYYRADDPEGEIVEDFEMRLGELFTDKMRLGHEVITLSLTKEVIAQLGRIEDLDAPDQEATPLHSEEGQEDSAQASATTPPPTGETLTDKLNKKLYRDPINKWIGGVIAGLSVHLGVDVLLLRLITVLLTFTPIGWIVFILYIIGWTTLPEASNATDRLRMEGKPINSANIWSAISKEDATTPANPEAEAKERKAKLRKNIIWGVVAFLILLLVIGSLIWGIVSISNGEGFFLNGPFNHRDYSDDEEIVWIVGLGILLAFFLFILSIVLLVGIVMLVYVWPISIVFKSSSLNGIAKFIIITLWILLTTFWIWI